MKIYDIFLYNGEKELLEIRFNILKDVVDRFVIIESPHTFTGIPKPFFLDPKDDYLKPFIEKVISIRGPSYYHKFSIWHNEWFARNLGGIFILDRAKDDDIILLSDIDEIPNPTTLKNNLDKIETPITFNQIYNFYKFNLECYTRGLWPGTVASKRKYINYPSPDLTEWFTRDFGLQKLREDRSIYPKIENGGNHYSYCSSTEEIQRKLKSFCHALDLNKPHLNNPEHINNCIKKGESIWVESDGNRLKKIEMNESNTPKYILDNLDKYKHLIL